MSALPARPATPVPVLRPGVVYIAHQDFVCIDCAGVTAKFTGYTLGGARLLRVTRADKAEWATYDMGPLTCGCGRVTA